MPFIVHLMIIGSTVFVKRSAPIRARFTSQAGMPLPVDPDLDAIAVSEIETLVLNAVMKK